MARRIYCRPYNKREINEFGLYVMRISGEDNIKALSIDLKYSESALFKWFKTDNILKLSCIFDVADYLSRRDGQSPEIHILKIMRFYPDWVKIMKRYENKDGRI